MSNETRCAEQCAADSVMLTVKEGQIYIDVSENIQDEDFSGARFIVESWEEAHETLLNLLQNGIPIPAGIGWYVSERRDGENKKNEAGIDLTSHDFDAIEGDYSLRFMQALAAVALFMCVVAVVLD